MSDVNIPLLRKALEWAEAEAAKPAELREWEQEYYVLPANQHEADRVNAGSKWWHFERQQKAPECGTCYCIAGYVAEVSGRKYGYESVARIACEELGIGVDYMHPLFEANNTIADVRRIAEDLAGERL